MHSQMGVMVMNSLITEFGLELAKLVKLQYNS